MCGLQQQSLGVSHAGPASRHAQSTPCDTPRDLSRESHRVQRWPLHLECPWRWVSFECRHVTALTHICHTSHHTPRATCCVTAMTSGMCLVAMLPMTATMMAPTFKALACMCSSRSFLQHSPRYVAAASALVAPGVAAAGTAPVANECLPKQPGAALVTECEPSSNETLSSVFSTPTLTYTPTHPPQTRLWRAASHCCGVLAL